MCLRIGKKYKSKANLNQEGSRGVEEPRGQAKEGAPRQRRGDYHPKGESSSC